MTGKDIKNLREAISITPETLATILGVNTSTVYRWEFNEDIELADSLQKKILLVLMQQESKADNSGKRYMGDSITNNVMINGGLYALYQILNNQFGE